MPDLEVDEPPAEWGHIVSTARRRYRIRVRVVLGLMLTLLGLFAAVVLVIAFRRDQGPLIAALVLGPMLVILGSFAGIAALAHRRGVKAFQAAPLMGVDRAHRRRIRRALKTGEHLAGLDERLAVDTALRLKELPWVFGPIGGVILLGAVLTVIGDGGPGPTQLVQGIFLLLMLVTLGQEYRRGRRYLDGASPEILALVRSPDDVPTP